MHFINAQGMDISPAARRAALLRAISDACALAANSIWPGAEAEPIRLTPPLNSQRVRVEA